jgi:pyrrolidone-carboxylate peptidase
MRALAASLALGILTSVAGCATEVDSSQDEVASSEDSVKVDTSSPAARAQYDANLAFAKSYKPRCAAKTAGRPRVIVTGFGRFMSVENNATGRMVSSLSGIAYPETTAPAAGKVDAPAPQLSVGTTTLDLPHAGKVDVCAMILPVYWDLAAVLIAKEVDAFGPSFVLMNGVAGDRQPTWIELGSVNRAAPLDDGSNQLRPAVGKNQSYAPIVSNASKADGARGLLLSWDHVRAAAATAIQKHAPDMQGEERFDAFVSGVELAGFPRESNTYLCNNVTYVTNYLMSYPGKSVSLMKASVKKAGAANELSVAINSDVRDVPRVFMHWSSALAGKHVTAGADVMRAVIDAQLTAKAAGEAPTMGDNSRANPDLAGGAFF